MFKAALKFNQNLRNWNVANVESFDSTFWNAQLFNGDISTWNVASATNMQNMLHQADSFTQDLCPWTQFVSRDFLGTTGFDVGECPRDGYGTFPSGTTCEATSQCAEGLYCSFVDGMTCQPKVAFGESCISSWYVSFGGSALILTRWDREECQTGFCKVDIDGFSGLCQLPMANGATCGGRDPSRGCVGKCRLEENSGAGVCVNSLQMGDPCISDGDCGTGYVCTRKRYWGTIFSDTNDLRCLPKGKEDDSWCVIVAVTSTGLDLTQVAFNFSVPGMRSATIDALSTTVSMMAYVFLGRLFRCHTLGHAHLTTTAMLVWFAQTIVVKVTSAQSALKIPSAVMNGFAIWGNVQKTKLRRIVVAHLGSTAIVSIWKATYTHN